MIIRNNDYAVQTGEDLISILVIISIGEYVHPGPVIHDVEPVAHCVGVQGVL